LIDALLVMGNFSLADAMTKKTKNKFRTISMLPTPLPLGG